MGIRYFLYFLIGGLMVAVVTYFAGKAKGLIAGFIANLPVITLITFLTVYFASGQGAVISYAKGLLIMLLPWLAYILSVIFLSSKFGFLSAIATGILLYFLIAYLILTKSPLKF